MLPSNFKRTNKAIMEVTSEGQVTHAGPGDYNHEKVIGN